MPDKRRLVVLAALLAFVAGARAVRAADAAPGASPAPAAAQRLTLADAVALASGHAPAVTLADLRQRESAARADQSRGALLPSLKGEVSDVDRTFNLKTFGISFPSIPGQPGFADLQGPVQDFEARVKVSQTVFSAADWMHWHASQVGVEASRGDRGATGEASAENAALAYLRAARAEALVDARRADVDIAEQLAGLAESQQKAGVAPAIDVTRARTQLAASRVAALSAVNTRDRAEIDLARALGQDPASRFALADSLGESLGASGAPAEPEAAVAFAVAHRPDLSAEEARLRRARAERGAISAERLPRLDVAGDWGASGEHAADALNTRTVSVALTMPLLDGGRREGRISEQTALLGESEVRARDLRDQIAADVRGALLDLDTGHQQIALARERLTLADQELAQARERFVNGVAGNIEVINAQSSLIQARDEEIAARFATAVARVHLARAAGVVQTVR
jgi:outer membrane protein TolC